MKRIISLVFIIALLLRCSALTPLASFAEENELNIPSLLSIPVIFKYPVTSSQISTGDVIPISINEDVFVEKTLVFKKGTDGVIFIDAAKKGRSWGRGGKIEITNGKLTDAFGNEHVVKISTQAHGDSAASGKILPVVGVLVFWPLAFFGFKKGDDAVIPAGKIVYAFTTEPAIVKVSSN